MRNKLFLFVALLGCTLMQGQEQGNPTIYQFVVKDIQGKPFDLSSLKGKKVMIVNTASKCGLTPQYKALEAVYQQYKDKGLVILGFPANNFKQQEPASNFEIARFCQQNYGVSFPMMEKISVAGKDQAPLYRFLTQKQYNGVTDAPVQWNFQKFLIGTNGKLEKVVAPTTPPDSPEIISWIQNP